LYNYGIVLSSFWVIVGQNPLRSVFLWGITKNCLLKPMHSLFTRKSVIDIMLKMVEMDENVTLAA
jgi:hypothetical protein